MKNLDVPAGYLLGDQWERVFRTIDHHIHMVTIVAAVLVAAYAIYRYWRSKRRRKPNPPQ